MLIDIFSHSVGDAGIIYNQAFLSDLLRAHAGLWAPEDPANIAIHAHCRQTVGA